MTDRQRLLAADAERRQAMIAADTSALSRLLAEDLMWTHSSGKTETKGEVIKALAEGEVTYEVLEMTQDRVLRSGGNFVHQGVLTGRAVRDGETKLLNARFLAVWQETQDQLQLLAWQSTQVS
ncbi:MAG: nuclear transport factor 2 family protein [Pseudomonadaceae bacterium]|nr:nuclear transport factor 2 family protein [Pseudomonadaceae bacterium]